MRCIMQDDVGEDFAAAATHEAPGNPRPHDSIPMPPPLLRTSPSVRLGVQQLAEGLAARGGDMQPAEACRQQYPGDQLGGCHASAPVLN